jgi:hypothetical protein
LWRFFRKKSLKTFYNKEYNLKRDFGAASKIGSTAADRRKRRRFDLRQCDLKESLA